MQNALEIKGLCKEYTGFALKDISFRLPSGYIMGLIGPNGAGKTTIIKLILNMIERQAGVINVLGVDNIAHETAIKSRIGFVHEEPRYHGYLKVKEIGSLFARFYTSWDKDGFSRLCDEFSVPENKKISVLSRGTKMKLSLALALAHNADLLLMDEPTTGLDPVFRREFLMKLSQLIQDENKAVLFSTHITSDLERTTDFITYIQNGKMLFSTTKDELFEKWAVVKGGNDILNLETEKLFLGIRKSEVGFKALTSNKEYLQYALSGNDFLLEKPSLEELMFLLSKGEINA